MTDTSQPNPTGTGLPPTGGPVNDALTGGNKGNVQLIYILYLLAFITGLTALIGLIMAYVSKDEAPDWLKTHYNFLIRTFWIGLLYSVIGAVLSVVVIGIFIWLFALVWWAVRCIQGLNLLGKNQPVAKYQSWFFA
jgi:uncharacterized membrane protein